MKIGKAIGILEDIRNINLNYYSPDRKNALKLGIEALKHIKTNRRVDNHPDQVLLPGETPPAPAPKSLWQSRHPGKIPDLPRRAVETCRHYHE